MGDTDWIDLAQEIFRWLAVDKAGNLLTSRKSVSFPPCSLLASSTKHLWSVLLQHVGVRLKEPRNTIKMFKSK